MIIPDTRGMSLQAWADATTLAADQYVNVNNLVGEDWQQWGMCFFNSPQLGTLHPPNPYSFDDWRTWGQLLGYCLANARGSDPRKAA